MAKNGNCPNTPAGVIEPSERKNMRDPITGTGPEGWTYAEQDAAGAEGWDLFATGGGKVHEPYELQALIDGRWEGDDEQAWRHVAERAADGSRLHERAIQFLRDQECWQEVRNVLGSTETEGVRS